MAYGNRGRALCAVCQGGAKTIEGADDKAFLSGINKADEFDEEEQAIRKLGPTG